MAFAHLHVHTEYSLLDGASRVSDLVKTAKKLKMESVAITDHGNMFGVVDFYNAAKAEGIHPVIGCEVYTAARSMEDKHPDKDKYAGHLVLLSENETGYKNLMKIVSAGYTKGFYYKPRVDIEILRRHSKGLIALSACLAGDVQRKLVYDDYDGAKAKALEFREIFGEYNFFLEVQNHDIPEQIKIIPALVRLHEETGIELVATNDVHYVEREFAPSHDALLCIQTGKTLDDKGNRMEFPNDQFYLKSEAEMRKLFPDLPDAIENTAKIAARCQVDFDFESRHLPEFKAPDGKTNAEYLRELCGQGLQKRYGADAEQHRIRLDREIGIIEDMGFIEYFLIVWDFIRYARDHEIAVGPGRGSAAGSLVSYCLGITNIDPIAYNLIFERFLNPERVSMPDIDIDFCYERRGEVIDYVIEKYGVEKVAQIVTFGRLKARAVIRDVGRVIGMPYGEVDRIAKMVPQTLGIDLSTAIRTSPDLKNAMDSDGQIRKLIETAMDLEGLARNTGTHAAGIVIAKSNLDDYVPLYKSDNGVSTQFTMVAIERLGLLKMDFLGLRNLTVIQDAIDMIEKNHGIKVDFDAIDYDDPAVYKMISNGNTAGVFQLESAGMTDFIKRFKPSCFEDIIAGIALYRPGPMSNIPTYIDNKRHPGRVKYLHSSLEPILSVTYGVMIYQEQVMEIVRDLAGYSYGRSDVVRAAMSKKKADIMDREEKYFVEGLVDKDTGEVLIQGCVRNGIPAKIAKELYAQMKSFGSYAFNKSHAAAYAVVAYQTAWLKAHYPVEFMAALMTSFMGDGTQIAKYIRNCTDMGVEVLPPSVQDSEKKFSVKNGKIRFGLLGVKHVGAAVGAIVAARAQGANFPTMLDFLKSVDLDVINKKAVESLIKAGAFDGCDENRAKHMAVYEMMMDRIKEEKKKVTAMQETLFGQNPDVMKDADLNIQLPDVNDFPRQQKLAWEKEMTGIYVSGHPLDGIKSILERMRTDEARFVTSDQFVTGVEDETDDAISEIASEGFVQDNAEVCAVGIISHVRTLMTKKEELMAFVNIDDLFGSVEVIVFSDCFKRSSEHIAGDNIVVVRGRVNYKEGEAPKIIASKITPISVVEAYYNRKGA